MADLKSSLIAFFIGFSFVAIGIWIGFKMVNVEAYPNKEICEHEENNCILVWVNGDKVYKEGGK